MKVHRTSKETVRRVIMVHFFFSMWLRIMGFYDKQVTSFVVCSHVVVFDGIVLLVIVFSVA